MLRRIAATLLTLTFATTAFAGAPAPRQDRLPDDEIGFAAPPDRPHLPSRALVMKALAKRRAINLARFHAYARRGVYPHDLIAQTTQNIWRDDDGHLCAAATMIDQDGQHALVKQTAENDNGIRLGTLDSGALYDWILTSGFTQVEVATIQEPMMGPREQPRNNDWRIAEDARLRRRYAQVERALRDNADNALEQAADRVLARPDLAWNLVGTLSAS